MFWVNWRILPPNLTYIGVRPFYSCTNLKLKIGIPGTLTTISERIFQGLGSVTGTIKLPEKINSVPPYLFDGCFGLHGSLVIPDGCIIINARAFAGSSGLDGKYIYAGAFLDCSNLKGKLNTNWINRMDESAFEGFSSLNGTLKISSNIEILGSSVFKGCSGFNKLIISDYTTITTISESLFEKCSGFQGELDIPKHITVIKSSAFAYCSGFNGSLIIPKKVYNINGNLDISKSENINRKIGDA